MASSVRISVVMPSFNEELAIGPMIESIRRHSGQFDTEILLVDSSSDRTAAIARELGARVVEEPPRGHGIALRKALEEACGEIIITADCDNTYPMESIPKLVELMQAENLDIISCNRLTRGLGHEMPRANRIANWSFAFLVRSLYGIDVHDVSTGMFCLRRRVVQEMSFETNYSFPCELIIKTNLAGYRFREVDIPYRPRIGEVTLHRWRSGKAYLRCIATYRFHLSIDPHKL